MTCALCRDCCEIVAGPAEVCVRCGGTRLLAHVEIESLGIAHVDCDAFYASVEKRDRPELAREPLIVGHAGGRGVVVTACYVARTFGVHSAMPMFQALELCPHATVIAPDMGKYKRVSEAIRTIFSSATSVVEPLSLDEAYLDLTDDYRTEAPPDAEALATISRRIEGEIGITVSIGLSCNKFLAKLASELEKPRGFSAIGRAEAKAFLAPVHNRKNLTVITGLTIDNLVFEGLSVTGVAGRRNGAGTIISGREVIVSAGVLNSPLLLQRSGIGPAPLLQRRTHTSRTAGPGGEGCQRER